MVIHTEAKTFAECRFNSKLSKESPTSFPGSLSPGGCKMRDPGNEDEESPMCISKLWKSVYGVDKQCKLKSLLRSASCKEQK